MDIKTKFQIGDTIYTIKNCRICEIVVKRISIYIENDGKTDIKYHKEEYTNGIREDEAFPSKEALLYHIQNS